ncbi:molecular chaperone HtpG [Temperatibacter marinus]|uniref:Chaperone protein HtpG n=1 Tax=Temperatibacter marinus TaxID=1456591 RepID=A0AA52EEM2_9PROT|nr:molecular chaperone HtpG [Temperatibacter marinus]WND03300.1 molecular chaperone HtpG [Temperatibacter marinus]
MADQDLNNGEKLGFEAEVSRLLHMMVHSVYSDREIFLRELISNASDACDKLRYEAQSDAALMSGGDFSIDLTADKNEKRLIIADNGIGMNRDDLIANLGTIARSGTAGFMDKLTGDSKQDVQLIGQFGVGFYSVFMVADHVTVTSRKAGDTAAWTWESTGEGSYTVKEAEKTEAGTEITLTLKEDAVEFLDKYRLNQVIKTYSDHIAIPINLTTEETTPGAEGEDDKVELVTETVNEGQAIWTRSKGDVTDEQHEEFYRHVSHAFDSPAHTMHYRVEGMQAYSVLMYIPTNQPQDLFDPARKNRVKLYVKRVYITDDSQDILPSYLRFMRGVVDSEDLPLNVSREMLQNNPTLKRMSGAITKKVLGELDKMSEKDAEKFETIWSAFGAVIKEGIYEDFERRDQIIKMARFKSTHSESLTSLDAYIDRMKEGQESLYYISGADVNALKKSPQLEGFKKKGVEVLLLEDAVDDFWLQMMPQYEGKTFKSITKGGSDLADIKSDSTDDETSEDKVPEGDLTTLITCIKEVLGDKVGDVKTTDRLVGTAACLVADENAMDMHMERLLKAHNQLEDSQKKNLEINPSHDLIKKLADKAKESGALETLADPILLLLDQATILEGDPLDDPSAFAKRLSTSMANGLV